MSVKEGKKVIACSRYNNHKSRNIGRKRRGGGGDLIKSLRGQDKILT
jgi:hypothetical protein